MRWAGAVLGIFLLTSPALAQPAAEADPALWPEEQRAFFQDGPAFLLSQEERRELLALDEAGRAAFIRELLERDPIPETPENELREGIERRRRLVREELGSFRDARAQLLFLRGKPAERVVIDCAAAFKPTEIWSYPIGAATKDVLLYRPSADEPFRLWLPVDSKRSLYTEEMEFWLLQWEIMKMKGKRIDRFFCPDSERIDRAAGVDGLGSGPAEAASERPLDFRWIRPEDRVLQVWKPASLAAWAKEAAATPLPPEPERLDVGALELDFPRRQGQRLTARALVTLPTPAGMEAVQVPGDKQRVRLTVDGVLERGSQVFETFRMRYQVAPPVDGSPAALLLERGLRPGQSFVLRLRIKDETSGAESYVTRGFQVPGQPEVRLAREAAAAAALGEAQDVSRVAGPDTLLLMPPPEEVMLGVWRAETIVSGDRIAKVTFLLDGQPQLTRARPPYSAELRLSTFPREQVVRAEGYDEAGELVAWDQVVLNQTRGGFRVLITDPARGARAFGKVTARAEVVVPEERKIAKVDFRLNDQPVASLTAPPWQREVQVPAGEDLVYLTVEAILDDGSRAEDVRFLRAPENLGEMEVDLVELFATALDGSGHPVRGLQAADFTVLEGGKPQKIARFEQVEGLPLSLGISIDTSFSMASSLNEAQRAAAGFIQNLVTPKDRCFTLAFADRPALLMPPVDDAEAVAVSLEGLKAFGRTALHDALLASLYYFRALRGQRALVLLTDGDDTSSSASWEDALEYARRSGVAVYPIGLGLSDIKLSARSKLNTLAEATGGRTFFIDRAEELSGVYERIEEELRSRYSIAYHSDQPADKNGFRAVEVKVKRGLKARVSRGIYP